MFYNIKITNATFLSRFCSKIQKETNISKERAYIRTRNLLSSEKKQRTQIFGKNDICA